MPVQISPAVRQKLADKHQVTAEEITQCFANRSGKSLLDNREEHRTDPPSKWFIAECDNARKLKVVYVVVGKGVIEIKTAYDPNEDEIRIYNKLAY